MKQPKLADIPKFEKFLSWYKNLKTPHYNEILNNNERLEIIKSKF